MEEWKEIQDYPNCQVSSEGRVEQDGKLRPLYKNKDGYMVVNIGKGKSRKQFRVNRLVASAFIPNPENKPQVNHKNSVRCDDRVENLEWSTSKENIQHSLKEGNRKPFNHGISKGMINMIKHIRVNLKMSNRGIGIALNIDHRKVPKLLLNY